MNVVVCDDDAAVRSSLRALLHTYADSRGIEMNVSEYENAEAFLDAHASFDILFMDIYMDGLDGTDAAWRLTAEERRRTVFLTTSTSHAIEAYQLRAAHYLLKPVSMEGVREAIERCAPIDNATDALVLSVRTTDGMVHIPMESICMIEAKNKTCIIYASGSDWRAYISLGSLERQLDARYFARVQRSYIVGLRHIKTLYHDRAVMDDGASVKVSRDRVQDVRRKYQNFMFALARGEVK